MYKYAITQIGNILQNTGNHRELKAFKFLLFLKRAIFKRKKTHSEVIIEIITKAFQTTKRVKLLISHQKGAPKRHPKLGLPFLFQVKISGAKDNPTCLSLLYLLKIK